MCIGKLAVNWWTLVGIRRLNCGYSSGLETYWMMPFMLRHELSLDSSVIIQYLFLYVITVLSHHGVFPCQLHTPLEIHQQTMTGIHVVPDRQQYNIGLRQAHTLYRIHSSNTNYMLQTQI